jgi:hypothetical protein
MLFSFYREKSFSLCFGSSLVLYFLRFTFDSLEAFKQIQSSFLLSQDIQKLSETDKVHLFELMDAFLRDRKTKKAYQD